MNGILAIDMHPCLEPIQAELHQVKACISEQLHFSEISLEPYLQSLCDKDDGMIRPALLLLAGKISGEFRDEHIQVAAVMEMIYRASLLHNRVAASESLQMYPDQMRLHGKTAFVLLGDFLLSRAFASQSHLRIRPLEEILSHISLSLTIGGLQMQLRRPARHIRQNDYIRIAEANTVSLFQSSCRLGALLAKASDNQIQILCEYGYRFGMAYQLADDLLRVLQVQEQLVDGITAEDLLKEPLFPVIHYCNGGPNHKINKGMSLQSLIAGMHKAGSFDYTLGLIKQFTHEAKSLLCSFAPGDYTHALGSLTDRIRGSVSSAETAV